MVTKNVMGKDFSKVRWILLGLPPDMHAVIGKILDESRGVAAYDTVSHTSMSTYLYQMIWYHSYQ